ncbi:MAG TPA: tol-pal system protein YbgF [Stellaceae bacterium]|jgi:tol-pal system protein YbgF
MIRRRILPQTWPAALLVFLAIAGSAAQAQDATTQERLDRLERDLSMLQRQVYSTTGGEAPPGAESGGNAAVDMQVRMDRLEQQIRDLTGRLEDETNQVEQLRQHLEQVNSDIDVRLGQGQRQPDAQAQHPASSGYASAEPPPFPPSPGIAPYGRPPPPAPGYGTLTPPGPDAGEPAAYGAPAQLTPPRTASAADADTLHPPGIGTLPSGSPSAQYNVAFGLLRQANYEAAEEALRNFVQQYPTNPLAGNAQYWLGESYLKRGKYDQAAAAFADGYKRFPKGPKAADSLLGLGRSLAYADQKNNACIALTQLDHDFPHASSAIRDRSAQEKKRLGC